MQIYAHLIGKFAIFLQKQGLSLQNSRSKRMTNKELEKKIEELSAQIEALKGEIKKEKPKGITLPKGVIWKPIEGEEYWYLDPDCKVYHNIFDGDKEWLENGNAYLTPKKAEYEANREKYTRLFRQYVEQHSKPLDWKDGDQEKWYVCYDTDTDNIRFEFMDDIKCMDIYGSSEEVMRDAVDFVGRENFLRYVIGVEENDGI